MKNVNDFYVRVLESLGLTVTEDKYIKSIDPETGKAKQVSTTNNIPMVLPVKEHINTCVEPNDEGEIELVKYMFNPLNEDMIKGDSQSIKRLKDIINARLNYSLTAVIGMLSELIDNKEAQTKANTHITKFLMNLKKDLSTAIKKEVCDDKYYQILGELVNKHYANKLIHIFLKKSATYNGVKYNRLVTADLPLYQDISSHDKNDPFHDMTLRNKDITVLTHIFSYIFDDLTDESGHIKIGSEDTTSPAFIALFKFYLIVMKRFQKIATSLKHINEELYDAVNIKLSVDISELDDLDVYEASLAMIPSDIDLNKRRAVAHAVVNQEDTALNRNTQQTQTNTGYNPKQPAANQTAQPQEEVSLAKRILYGNMTPATPNMMGGNPAGFGGFPGTTQQAPVNSFEAAMNNTAMKKNMEAMMGGGYDKAMFGKTQSNTMMNNPNMMSQYNMNPSNMNSMNNTGIVYILDGVTNQVGAFDNNTAMQVLNANQGRFRLYNPALEGNRNVLSAEQFIQLAQNPSMGGFNNMNPMGGMMQPRVNTHATSTAFMNMLNNGSSMGMTGSDNSMMNNNNNPYFTGNQSWPNMR